MEKLDDDNKNSIEALLAVMARLRRRDGGCPWDVEQTFKTVAPYTVEEAYEVADAIEQDDMDALKDELGDLLFQVVFHAQMAQEAGFFDFNDVVEAVTAKMISRHPHVFGDAKANNASDVNKLWEDRKDQETKRQKANSILDDVTRALPAMIRAQKLQKRAARVGFEWDNPALVLDKLEEETAEMREALQDGHMDEIADELGDLFFVLTNMGRMLGLDCEDVFRKSNIKFERRFKYIESNLKLKNKEWADTNLDEMEALWQDAKKLEKPKSAA